VVVKALAVGDYEFKIADASWTNDTSFGLTDNTNAISLDATVDVVSNTTASGNAQNIKLTIATAGDYLFIFDSTKNIVKVSKFAKSGLDIYVRGTVTSWSATDATNKLVESPSGVYTLKVNALAVGDYEFKVADASWTNDTSFGLTDNTNAISLDTTVDVVSNTAASGNAQNIKLTIATAGNYIFKFFAAVNKVKVSKE